MLFFLFLKENMYVVGIHLRSISTLPMGTTTNAFVEQKIVFLSLSIGLNSLHVGIFFHDFLFSVDLFQRQI